LPNVEVVALLYRALRTGPQKTCQHWVTQNLLIGHQRQ
jgi:hypothetical protein